MPIVIHNRPRFAGPQLNVRGAPIFCRPVNASIELADYEAKFILFQLIDQLNLKVVMTNDTPNGDTQAKLKTKDQS